MRVCNSFTLVSSQCFVVSHLVFKCKTCNSTKHIISGALILWVMKSKLYAFKSITFTVVNLILSAEYNRWAIDGEGKHIASEVSLKLFLEERLKVQFEVLSACTGLARRWKISKRHLVKINFHSFHCSFTIVKCVRKTEREREKRVLIWSKFPSQRLPFFRCDIINASPWVFLCFHLIFCCWKHLLVIM